MEKKQYIYFETRDGKSVDNHELAKIANIVDRMCINEDDLEAIRDYARMYCRGIRKEVERPTITFFLMNGEKIKAIQYCHRTNPDMTLKEVRDFVNKIEQMIVS